MTDLGTLHSAGTRHTPTAGLASAVTGLRFADLPAPVVTIARQCVLDVLGTMMAGSREPAARIVTSVMTRDAAGGPCTIAGTAARAPASAAALVNGTAAHALDFDDVIATVGHPSVAVAPAALAVAERTGCSGRDLLAAFVAGVEAQARVADAVGPAHYARGFHSTATFGSFGAAAAASHLLGLDTESVTAALGIAGTQAAGLKAVFGTMSKPLHAGRAACNGVLAADLAAQGFTSAGDILGDPQGFAATQAGHLGAEVLDTPFGDPWRMLDVRFKLHAACFLTHASIDSLVALSHEHGVAADDVDRVDIAVPPGHLAVCGIPEPRTGLEGKFSLRFTAALALLRRSAGPGLFTDESVSDPALTALRDRVRVTPDAALSGPVARVQVTLKDSRQLGAYRDMQGPAWQHDPAEQTGQLLAKFRALAAPVLGDRRAGQLAEAACDVDALADVRPLCELLGSAAA